MNRLLEPDRLVQPDEHVHSAGGCDPRICMPVVADWRAVGVVVVECAVACI